MSNIRCDGVKNFKWELNTPRDTIIVPEAMLSSQKF
jgi:hypothetical protein